jgi:hypothetical protein
MLFPVILINKGTCENVLILFFLTIKFHFTMKKTVDKIPFYRLGWNNSYLCNK